MYLAPGFLSYSRRPRAGAVESVFKNKLSLAPPTILHPFLYRLCFLGFRGKLRGGPRVAFALVCVCVCVQPVGLHMYVCADL